MAIIQESRKVLKFKEQVNSVSKIGDHTVEINLSILTPHGKRVLEGKEKPKRYGSILGIFLGLLGFVALAKMLSDKDA